MDKKNIIAIAAAVIAEEENIDVQEIRIISCHALSADSLQNYIASHGIEYKKYQLED